MGSNSNHQTVIVEAPDLLQVMGAKGVPINGCKWCRRTIFWNGAFWNHTDGEASCKGQKHEVSEDSFADRIQENQELDYSWPHIFLGKLVVRKVTVRDWKCKTCGTTSHIRGGLYGDCQGNVATPATVTPGVPA